MTHIFMLFFIIIWFVLFTLLAYKNFRYAIGLFIIILPAYLIKYSYGPVPYILKIPTTALEVSFFAIFLVWIIKYAREDIKVIKKVIINYRLLFILIGLFLLATTISIFVSDMPWRSFGHWKAYFLEPIILFFILLGRFDTPLTPLKGGTIRSPLEGGRGVLARQGDKITVNDLILFLALSTLSISIYAIIQKFTGWGISTPEWTNQATRRVTSFFTSPNSVGLYLGPIIVLTISFMFSLYYKNKRYLKDNLSASSLKRRRRIKKIFKRYYLLILIVFLALLTILFTKSEGAWVALAAGIIIFIFLIGYRKIATTVVVLGIIFSMLAPSLRTALLFQDQAGQNRFTLWSYSWEYMTESPKNFVFGTGIRQFFRKIQKPHYDDAKLERLLYPHNIFLNFWTETGLLGMLSFSGILFYLFYLSYKIRKKDLFLGAGLIAALSVIVVHGLVDTPYFKNDLAMVFWVLAALIFNKYHVSNKHTRLSRPRSVGQVTHLHLSS